MRVVVTTLASCKYVKLVADVLNLVTAYAIYGESILFQPNSSKETK